jgi:hypothetical protein
VLERRVERDYFIIIFPLMPGGYKGKRNKKWKGAFRIGEEPEYRPFRKGFRVHRRVCTQVLFLLKSEPGFFRF